MLPKNIQVWHKLVLILWESCLSLWDHLSEEWTIASFQHQHILVPTGILVKVVYHMILNIPNELLQNWLIDDSGVSYKLIKRVHRIDELVSIRPHKEYFVLAETLFGLVVSATHSFKLSFVLQDYELIFKALLILDIFILIESGLINLGEKHSN